MSKEASWECWNYLNRIARLGQEYVLMTLPGKKREQDPFQIAGLLFHSLFFEVLITAVSNWHSSLRNVSECEYECVGGSIWLQTHNYLKSNTVSISSQPSKSHINETSPNSKVKKFFPFEIIQMDSASFFWEGDTLYGTDGLMALWQTNFSSFLGGWVGRPSWEWNMYSGLDRLLYSSLHSLVVIGLFLNVAVRNTEG